MNKLMPAAFLPDVNFETKVYYVSFPEDWKDKLFEIESLKWGRPSQYNLPTNSLDKLLLSWLPGVVSSTPLSKNRDSQKWIVSCNKVDLDMLAELIKIWILGEYIEKQKISSLVKEKAIELYGLIDSKMLLRNQTDIRLFEQDGTASSSETFRVFALKIVERLTGKTINLGGKTLKFLYSGKNELITDPVELYVGKKKEYFSIVLDFSIQTTPPNRKAMVLYNLSVRRWVGVTSTAWDFRKDSTKAYIKTGDNKLQAMRFKHNSDSKQLEWDETDKKCYEFCKLENQLIDLNEVIQAPSEFVKTEVGSVSIVYRYALGMYKHKVKPGLPMIDKIRIHQWLRDQLDDILCETSYLDNVSKSLGGIDDTAIDKQNPEVFKRRMAQAIGCNKLKIEIYCSDNSEIGDKVFKKINEHFGITCDNFFFSELNVSIELKPLGKIGDVLFSKKEKLLSFEKRMAEIKEICGQAEIKPTACIIVLPGKEAFDDEDLDPKKAIRAGFAMTGRLTQFIQPEVNGGEDESEESEANRIIYAIYDLYRQLGYLYPLKSNRRFKEASLETPALGVWVVNCKNTVYGKTERFPVFVETDYVTGQIRVDCGLFSRPNLLYWEACLEFQKIPGNKNAKDDSKKAAYSSIKSKMLELINTHKKPIVVLVKSDGVSRQIWKFISDSELNKAEREGKYTLKSIWFDNSESENNILLDSRENGIRIIRVRANEEVPDYLSEENCYGSTRSLTGIFKYEDIFWSVAPSPKDKLFLNSRNRISKVTHPTKECKKPDMVELYPIYLKKADNPAEWVYLTHFLRKVAHQYRETLRMPLPLHLALKLEEYMG